jgi:hypothetical protein
MPRVRNLVLRNSPEQRIRSVSAAYTLTMGDDDILLVNSTAASRTITLPALADAYDAQLGVGKTFYIQKITAANSVIIEGDGAETINGSANQTLGSQFAAVKLVAGPSEWTMLSSGSISTADLADNAVTNAKMADDAVDSAEIADGAIDLVHMSAESVDSDQYVDGSIDVEHLSTGCVTPVKILATLVNPAADAACAILNTTTEINVSVTGAGNVAISTTSSVAGQEILIIATSVAGGGSYTLALVSGTLTLNSTGETALIKRNSANTGWRVQSLSTNAAGGALATIV